MVLLLALGLAPLKDRDSCALPVTLVRLSRVKVAQVWE